MHYWFVEFCAANKVIINNNLTMTPGNNPFKQHHQIARTILYNAAVELCNTNFINATEGNRSLTRMEIVLDKYQSYSLQEYSMLETLISQYGNSLPSQISSVYQLTASMASRMYYLIPLYESAVSSDCKKDIGFAICKAFTEFVAYSIYQMSQNEKLVNPLLWSYYGEDTILLLQDILSTSLELLIADQGQKKVNPGDLIRWLKSAKKSVPGYIFDHLQSIASADLPARLNDLVLINTPAFVA